MNQHHSPSCESVAGGFGGVPTRRLVVERRQSGPRAVPRIASPASGNVRGVVLSDEDEQADLIAAREYSLPLKRYTWGWRDYLCGRRRPQEPNAARGYDDAKSAHEVHGRSIVWSLNIQRIVMDSL